MLYITSNMIKFYILIILDIIILHRLTTCKTNGVVVNDVELLNISEEIFNTSSNTFYRHLCTRYQGQITFKNFTDNASERLFDILPNKLVTPTTTSLIKLFDNYELDNYKSEIITKEEDAEENEFINNLMKTDAMLSVMHFLSVKGFFIDDLNVHKNILKEIWFYPYSRGKGINSSSGFEHVFIGEKKPKNGVVGVHNWIFFYFGELENKINYFGHSRNKEFHDSGYFRNVLHLQWKTQTMFIGTTPELDIALYTLCFFTRPNRKCKISFTGSQFSIQTYILKSNKKACVGTAFPVIQEK